jgi:hypothetical protein
MLGGVEAELPMAQSISASLPSTLSHHTTLHDTPYYSCHYTQCITGPHLSIQCSMHHSHWRSGLYDRLKLRLQSSSDLTSDHLMARLEHETPAHTTGVMQALPKLSSEWSSWNHARTKPFERFTSSEDKTCGLWSLWSKHQASTWADQTTSAEPVVGLQLPDYYLELRAVSDSGAGFCDCVRCGRHGDDHLD